MIPVRFLKAKPKVVNRVDYRAFQGQSTAKIGPRVARDLDSSGGNVFASMETKVESADGVRRPSDAKGVIRVLGRDALTCNGKREGDYIFKDGNYIYSPRFTKRELRWSK